MAAFKLQNEKKQSIVQFYYDNIRQFDNSYDNFLLTPKGTPLTNPLQFICRTLHKHNIAGMDINTINYRHIEATKIQENIEDLEIRKCLHQETNQTKSTVRKRYKMQTIGQTSKNIDTILELIEEK